MLSALSIARRPARVINVVGNRSRPASQVFDSIPDPSTMTSFGPQGSAFNLLSVDDPRFGNKRSRHFVDFRGPPHPVDLTDDDLKMLVKNAASNVYYLQGNDQGTNLLITVVWSVVCVCVYVSVWRLVLLLLGVGCVCV